MDTGRRPNWSAAIPIFTRSAFMQVCRAEVAPENVAELLQVRPAAIAEAPAAASVASATAAGWLVWPSGG